ncbi:fasciclin domain-containing protein [Spirosoma fluviale]|uniref:Uncaracterized surface protein containing fasciclin (FAS1) repeats n=1 Tax=Spirosoma fluviale TaxID=1597977 RepID=A0A286GQ33_9BACT|nr:fasciclin domain-containing protein [Spirosoma fluviale]SOD97657.1 Uncaracterized surface protein containing fasciclin (FAS1) repeats [Spirosoma fluviale]
MKIKQSFSLLALGTTLLAVPVWAQTTPPGAATSTTYPQGAIATDSMPTKPSRDQKRAMKRNKRATNQKAGSTGTTTNTSSQDAAYRESSSSVGTAVNNSNTTNYNSNNVTNAPTGAGSNPNAMGASNPSTTPADQVSNGQNNSAARSSSSSAGAAYSPNTGATDSNAGTAAAVSGEKNSKEPAVKAGSTERNTSIGDFVASSPNFITLQNALQSANLWDVLKGSGPYTIFAPTNNAFKKLSSTAQGALLDGSNRDALKQLLSYHVVDGSLSVEELGRQAKAGNGKAQLKTLAGSTLTVQESNGRLTITDEQGHTATVEEAGQRQSNGMVYGINNVLMPKSGAEAFK